MTPKTILIIDDDATLVVPLKDGLESAGYKVAAAFDGVQGLLLAHQSKPDLIILDYYMPGGTGGSVYEKLRMRPDTQAIPVVFSTGVTLEELKGSIKPGPKTFFLRKPVGFQGVLNVVNQVLGENRKAMTSVVYPAAAGAPAAEPKAEEPKAAKAKPAKIGRAKPKTHEFEVRVTYADTDKAGIIYYANYYRYLEQGRTELLRSLGVRYRDLEVVRKLFLPAVESGCRYLAPSRYDDLLTVRTWIAELGRASVTFACEIVDKELEGKVVAEVFSRHAIVTDLWRPARVPPDLRALLAPFVAK
ncbi:MAG: YbgC/FadM family acyl-CoA thioesterase [Elusimicrobiota bacterium]|nr:YbgC/FadM family acyl-CoA thioesterase [Elusimicrobiota bacterium]